MSLWRRFLLSTSRLSPSSATTLTHKLQHSDLRSPVILQCIFNRLSPPSKTTHLEPEHPRKKHPPLRKTKPSLFHKQLYHRILQINQSFFELPANTPPPSANTQNASGKNRLFRRKKTLRFLYNLMANLPRQLNESIATASLKLDRRAASDEKKRGRADSRPKNHEDIAAKIPEIPLPFFVHQTVKNIDSAT